MMKTGNNWLRKLSLPFILACAFVVAASCSKPVPASPTGGNAAAVSGGQGAPQGQQGGRRSAIIPVQAVVVQVGLLRADRTTAGIIVPVVQSQVATQVAGFVARVPRLVGDWVKTGDVVVQLDDSQLKLTLATAEATLENVKINLAVGKDNSNQASPKLAFQVQSARSAYDSAKKFYDSQKALFDLGGIAASQLDTANSQLAAAQANLEGAKTALDQNNNSGDQTIAQLNIAVRQAQNQVDQARLNLQNTSIKVPFDGQIAAINMQPGMYANISTPVFSLVSAERQISFNIPPSDAPYMTAGMPLSFVYAGKTYAVKVKQAPSAPISGVLPMVASVGGLALQYGAVGEIDYSVPLAEGALIPISSLDTLENQNFVFAIENGRAVVKNVAINGESGTTAVVSGLQSGDTVIVSPPPGLIPGSQVQPTIMTPQAGGADSAAKAANAQPGAKAPGTPGAGPGQTGGQSGGKKGQGAAAGSSGRAIQGGQAPSGGQPAATQGGRPASTQGSASQAGSP
jgi:multidrug resistance efflux pump